jgi:hypothetical protein
MEILCENFGKPLQELLLLYTTTAKPCLLLLLNSKRGAIIVEKHLALSKMVQGISAEQQVSGSFS